MMGYGKGMFHITDAAEFRYFSRPAVAVATLQGAQGIAAGTPRTFTISIRDGVGNTIPDLEAAHDRYLHTVIVSEDLSVFSHIHPQGDVAPMLASGDFPLTYTFPKPGRYLIAVDFTVRAQEFSQEFLLDVSGPPALQKAADPPSDAYTVRVGDTDVTFVAPAAVRSGVGTMAQVSFAFSQNGRDVTDLQPYLAAPMHIAVVRDDLRYFVHSHGQLPRPLWDRLTNLSPPTHVHTALPDLFGPRVDATVSFPAPGTYAVFGEFKRGGKVYAARFFVHAR
jgi:Cu+-exporting ATPase